MATPSDHRPVRRRGREEVPPERRLMCRGRGGGVQAPLDCQPACAEGGGRPPRPVLAFVHPFPLGSLRLTRHLRGDRALPSGASVS